MINYPALKEVVSKSGIKKSSIANHLGITRANLYDKLNGNRIFDVTEVYSLKEILRLSDQSFLDIFFNNNVGNLPASEVKDGHPNNGRLQKA